MNKAIILVFLVAVCLTSNLYAQENADLTSNHYDLSVGAAKSGTIGSLSYKHIWD